jgi:hypothetical protein
MPVMVTRKLQLQLKFQTATGYSIKRHTRPHMHYKQMIYSSTEVEDDQNSCLCQQQVSALNNGGRIV